MRKEKSAGIIIFYNENDKPVYLLLKYQRYGRVHWGFVKGEIEKGENEKEAAKREAEEETGQRNLVFIPSWKWKQNFYFRDDNKELVSKDVIFFLAETMSEKVKLSFEHSEYKWFNYSDAINQFKYKNQKEMLENANALVLKWMKQKKLS